MQKPDLENHYISKFLLKNFYINHTTTTVGIRLTDMSGNRMVKTCLIAEWHSVIGTIRLPDF